MSATIIVVEDEPLLREMTVDFLEDAKLVVDGPRPLTTRSTFSQTERRRSVSSSPMPGKLDGLSPARVVLECWPHIAVVVTSGAFKNADVW